MKITKLLLAACVFSASMVFAETYKLENGKIRFEVDGNGRLVSLKNFETNREYTKGGGGLWRIVYQDGLSIEELLDSENVPVKVEKKGDSLVLDYGGEFPVKVNCRLEGDDVRFVAEIKNASKDKIFREFQFPMIRNVDVPDDSDFMWAYSGGHKFKNPNAFVRGGFTAYMGQDNKEVQRYILYPGRTAMNCFLINEPNSALYFANYDPNYGKTLHLGILPNVSKEGLREYGKPTFCMVKYPFLKPGESKVLPEYVVSPQTGDWHKSMKKYRAWAESSWYKPRAKTKDYLECNGWQRIILRHQYGKVLFGYDKIPEIYSTTEDIGMHTIRLYGWWKEGMDAGNPHYSPDDTQGGDAELAKQIKAVQKRGGKVNLYFNGQLIDTDTEFFRTVGKKICIKRTDGTPHIERYPFGGDGTALRVFGNKTFAVGCPYTKEWRDKLIEIADRAIGLGADGIYYDQMGHDVLPCADPTHGHPVPFMEINKCKHEMFKSVCEYIRAKKPGMTIGVEWVCDPIAPLVDYVHNCYGPQDIDGKDKNGRPYVRYAPLYQYAFPEYSTCDTTLFDGHDIVRRVNHSLMRSWRSDVSVYRCRATVDAVPAYRNYLKKANALRDRFRDLILNGLFRDTDLATCSNPQVFYYTYENGNRMAVITTQWHLPFAKANFKPADGYKYVEHGGIGDYTVEADGDVVKTSLKKEAIVVIVFEKK